MAKRYTDSTIWKTQLWFKRLKPEYKLVWKYITDQCNHAGIWSVDVLSLQEDTGIDKFSIAEFMAACNRDFDKFSGKEKKRERVVLHKEKIWITGFIQYQYENKEGVVNAHNPVAVKALEILRSEKLLDDAVKRGFIKTK